MGYFYGMGKGTNKDEVEAVKWYAKSAEQGDLDAQYNLALCYRYGRGVVKNDQEAFRWMTRVAQAGDPVGQYNLGVSYRDGIGARIS